MRDGFIGPASQPYPFPDAAGYRVAGLVVRVDPVK